MRALAFLPILLAIATACALFDGASPAPDEPPPVAEPRAATPDEPAHVVVTHVLISFEGAAEGVRGATRTNEEARRLAEQVLELARSGRDFAELVRLYSDDRTNAGKYALANWGVPTGDDEFARQKMARGFGALAFSLPVGGVGLVAYDVHASPHGWHVLKRTR